MAPLANQDSNQNYIADRFVCLQLSRIVVAHSPLDRVARIQHWPCCSTPHNLPPITALTTVLCCVSAPHRFISPVSWMCCLDVVGHIVAIAVRCHQLSGASSCVSGDYHSCHSDNEIPAKKERRFSLKAVLSPKKSLRKYRAKRKHNRNSCVLLLGPACDLKARRAHPAYLCAVWVKHIDLVSLDAI